MARKRRYEQTFFARDADLPAGCCHINHFGDVGSWAYKALSRAAIDGEIESWKKARTQSEAKLGPVFVRRDQAADYLASRRQVSPGACDPGNPASAIDESPAFVRLMRDVADILNCQATVAVQINDVLLNVQRINRELGVAVKSAKED